jgi:hypothetical protein
LAFFFVPHYFLYFLFREFSFLKPGNLLYSNYRDDCSTQVAHILTNINSDHAFRSILILSPYLN